MSKFVNLIEGEVNFDDFHSVEKVSKISELSVSDLYLKGLVSPGEIKSIEELIEDIEWQPVSFTGMKGNYTPGDPIGSYRATIYDEKYALKLWERIKEFLPEERKVDEYSSVDVSGHYCWKPVGVSPVFRVIKYTSGGKLVVHYDSSYIESDNKRTLQSLVIYIKHEDITGGRTRFLEDSQKTLKFTDRIHEDQYRFAEESEVIYTPPNNSGGAIIFDHHQLHDGEEVSGSGEKIIIRSDIFFEKVYK